jgi:hypothetical protein
MFQLRIKDYWETLLVKTKKDFESSFISFSNEIMILNFWKIYLNKISLGKNMHPGTTSGVFRLIKLGFRLLSCERICGRKKLKKVPFLYLVFIEWFIYFWKAYHKSFPTKNFRLFNSCSWSRYRVKNMLIPKNDHFTV